MTKKTTTPMTETKLLKRCRKMVMARGMRSFSLETARIKSRRSLIERCAFECMELAVMNEMIADDCGDGNGQKEFDRLQRRLERIGLRAARKVEREAIDLLMSRAMERRMRQG